MKERGGRKVETNEGGGEGGHEGTKERRNERTKERRKKVIKVEKRRKM